MVWYLPLFLDEGEQQRRKTTIEPFQQHEQNHLFADFQE
jgi:hypothetical protein